jgi:hypothetical protein
MVVPYPSVAQQSDPGKLEAGLKETDTGLQLPPLSVELIETSGSVMKKTPGSSWKAMDVGETLNENDIVRTDEGSTATLRIPALALVSLGTSTTLEISKLNRTQQEEGLFLEEESITVNEINLETENGKVKNSLKDYENVENDYRLTTNNAVMGVRGTAFQCDVSTNRTECSVLEGSVQFSNRRLPDFSVQLNRLERSSLTGEESAPSEPESVSDTSLEDLKKLNTRTDTLLALSPILDSVSVEGDETERTGENRYRSSVGYREGKTITISGIAQARAPDASLSSVIVRYDGTRLDVDGLNDWSTSFELPALEGEPENVTLTVQLVDSRGNRSSVYSVDLQLTRTGEGVVPEGLTEGGFSPGVRTVSGNPAKAIDYPVALSGSTILSRDLANDTQLSEVSGFPIAGEVGVDSSVAGVAYRYEGQQTWTLADGTRNWSIQVPLRTIQARGRLSLEIMAWTSDGYRSEIQRIGPFTYNRQDAVIPLAYQPGDVSVFLSAVEGVSASNNNVPDSFALGDLGDGNLTFTGRANADSPIQNVAYSLDGGQTWSKASGGSNWTIEVPVESAQTVTVQVLAWTGENLISDPIRIGPIEIQESGSSVPWEYDIGDVSVTPQSIAGRTISNLEFPYHLYQGDADQNGVNVAGQAGASGSIAGVAYSLDGGESWQRANGGNAWSFRIPSGASTTYEPQIIAWTVDGVRSEAVELGTLNYEAVTFGTAIREQFRQLWRDFSNQNDQKIMNQFSSDFQFTDSLTGRSLTFSGFSNFLGDFYSGVRNLSVFQNLNQVFASGSGGEVNFSLEWRGTENETNQPFVMFGRNSRFKYRRADNGQFRIVSFENFPLVLYLFHRRQLRIPELDGVVLESLDVVSKGDADIINNNPTYDVNTLSVGGDITRGGIMLLDRSGFSGVESIPSLNGNYKESAAIRIGGLYAVNIRTQFGEGFTGLIRTTGLQSGYVDVQMISAKSPPGISPEVYRSFRRINPYE